ncbi:bifunctional tetrahydrofolate synthase/dihydrofolate synthase [Motiliproteus sp. SC1-56]|uniref:bifunctional tetrahydrofolate synthase/dihydrofolate synthase n=1 Tax=Motiliproteus sp. SC1-56 TaxID=2799565 RepID=UPI00351C7EDD
MEFSSLSEWLAFIEAVHPVEIELGLARTRAVAEELGLLETSGPKVITVAGTNGKGSTVAYMGAMLKAGGYRFGAYTSPHFLRYNERVQLDGEAVSDALLCEAFSCVEAARDRCNVSLTYFEYGTLAALWIFRQQPLDVVLLEVGLGGRLDAVNVIDPDVAVVTTVSLDHEAWLGADLEQIGLEKAGIFRATAKAVLGDPGLPASVAAKARSLGVEPLVLEQDFGRRKGVEDWCFYGVDQSNAARSIGAIGEPRLPEENAATAIQALLSAGLALSDEAVRTAVSRARLTGRWQECAYHGRKLVLDVAHNPQAAAYLGARLAREEGTTRCVLGMLDDKDVRGCIKALAPHVTDWCLASLGVPRGLPATVLLDALQQTDSEALATCHDTVDEALDRAVAESAAGERILVAGSFFTVAGVLARLEQEQ